VGPNAKIIAASQQIPVGAPIRLTRKTSNDNPYSESQFKTLKYRPDFPRRFASIEAVPLENRIRLVTCGFSMRQAA
jgi:hypothetical protein